jgi:predicted DNA-binding antitoxin AbrB/MazE fold protein
VREQVLEAIYREGLLTPLEPLDLAENQRVLIAIHPLAGEEPEEAVSAWQRVYAGLSEQEINEIEHIALDRIRSTQPGWRR